jgi:hypothetical protein
MAGVDIPNCVEYPLLGQGDYLMLESLKVRGYSGGSVAVVDEGKGKEEGDECYWCDQEL